MLGNQGHNTSLVASSSVAWTALTITMDETPSRQVAFAVRVEERV